MWESLVAFAELFGCQRSLGRLAKALAILFGREYDRVVGTTSSARNPLIIFVQSYSLSLIIISLNRAARVDRVFKIL